MKYYDNGHYAVLWVNRSKERAVHSKTDTGSNPARPKTMRLFLLSKESHTPFLKGRPMTSSPDNNNIPLKNFLAKPWKGQRGNCCYIAETEIANTNQLSTKTICFCPWCQEGNPFAAPTTA